MGPDAGAGLGDGTAAGAGTAGAEGVVGTAGADGATVGPAGNGVGLLADATELPVDTDDAVEPVTAVVGKDALAPGVTAGALPVPVIPVVLALIAASSSGLRGNCSRQERRADASAVIRPGFSAIFADKHASKVPCAYPTLQAQPIAIANPRPIFIFMHSTLMLAEVWRGHCDFASPNTSDLAHESKNLGCQADLFPCTIFMAVAMRVLTSLMLAGMINVVVASDATLP